MPEWPKGHEKRENGLAMSAEVRMLGKIPDGENEGIGEVKGRK